MADTSIPTIITEALRKAKSDRVSNGPSHVSLPEVAAAKPYGAVLPEQQKSIHVGSSAALTLHADAVIERAGHDAGVAALPGWPLLRNTLIDWAVELFGRPGVPTLAFAFNARASYYSEVLAGLHGVGTAGTSTTRRRHEICREYTFDDASLATMPPWLSLRVPDPTSGVWHDPHAYTRPLRVEGFQVRVEHDGRLLHAHANRSVRIDGVGERDVLDGFVKPVRADGLAGPVGHHPLIWLGAAFATPGEPGVALVDVDVAIHPGSGLLMATTVRVTSFADWLRIAGDLRDGLLTWLNR